MPSKVTPEAISDYKAGIPIAEIVKKYGVSKTQFYRRLNMVDHEIRGPINRFTTQQLTRMASEYESGSTIAELVEKHGSCLQTISAGLKKIGCQIRVSAEYSRQFTDGEIWDCIDSYLGGLSSTKAAERCGASAATVIRWLKDYGITRRHQPEYGGIGNYFANLDAEGALYWFGFLCADGHISAGKYIITLLGQKDKDHLELFKKSIEYTKPVKLFSRMSTWKDRVPKLYHYASLAIGCVEMVRDLLGHGINLIKAGDYTPLDKISDKYYHHFLRGFFDGDGSISVTKHYRWTWSMCGEHRELLEYIMQRCPVVDRNNCIVQCNKPYKDIWRIVYQSHNMISAISKWMYRDAMIFLPRKKDRADKQSLG